MLKYSTVSVTGTLPQTLYAGTNRLCCRNHIVVQRARADTLLLLVQSLYVSLRILSVSTVVLYPGYWRTGAKALTAARPSSNDPRLPNFHTHEICWGLQHFYRSNKTLMSAGSELTLHQKWVVWFDNPRLAPEASDWKDNLKKCGDFDTVSCFWSLFNNLKPASKLPLNSNYHVFRDGVEPMWEDPANKKGGQVCPDNPQEGQQGRSMRRVVALYGLGLDWRNDRFEW